MADQRTQEPFPTSPDVMHELKESQVERQGLLKDKRVRKTKGSELFLDFDKTMFMRTKVDMTSTSELESC